MPARVMKGERGVALVIVLGLVALVGSWAATAAYEDMIALRRAENMQDAIRAVQASRSALALAVKILREDAADSTTDDLQEAWAIEAPPFPIDEGMVSGVIEDAERRLNLNDLVNAKGEVQQASVVMFRRLFRHLEIDEALVDALVDWVDADDQPFGAGGAESSAYYDVAYRVKNAPFDGLEELALVKGFEDPELRARLRDYLTVLPPAQNGITPVNVNTAEARVLQAIFPKMTDADAETLIAGRPYADVASATNGQPWVAGGDPARLSVASSAFMVRTEARFGRVVLREEYCVRREGKKLTLLSRRQLGWGG